MKNKSIKDIKDARFTISKEFCGYAKARHVLRFCGEFLSSHPSEAKARIARVSAIIRRRESVASIASLLSA
jgi:hypothetical protein